jgi:hypothetical protein
MLVTTVGITAVVAAGVFGWRMLRDEPTRDESAAADWNQIVFVDRASGTVTAIDPENPTAAAGTTASTTRASAVHVEGDRLAVVQTGQITLTSVDGTAPGVVPIEPGSTVVRLPIADALWLAVGDDGGGNVVLVDGIRGATYDVGELVAPTQIRVFLETLRHDDDGSAFAMADAINFQTIVVHTDAEPPTATFFADQPVAVDDELLVTSEVVGSEADLTLRDAERKPLATVSGELPVGGVLADGEVTIVSVDGTMSRFGKDDTETERLGTIAVPAGASIRWVQSTANGSRFVVFGDTFEAVVDLDGRTVYTTTFTTAVDAPTVDPGWACLPVGGGDTYTALVDLESGELVADLTGLAVTDTSADGCTVIGTRNGVTEVVDEEGTAQIGQTRSATLAPDGDAVVIQTMTGATQFIELDGTSLGTPVDLSAVTPASALVTFREA